MGLIGSALGAAGAIFGGIKAARSARKAKKNIERQQRENREWYNRRYNEDATQRSDTQRLLSRVSDDIRKRNRYAEGVQAVMGGTDESLATAREANNQALADTASQIAANNEARKDNIEATYLQNNAVLQDKLNQIQQGRAQAITGAIQGVSNAAGAMDFGDVKIGKNKVAL